MGDISGTKISYGIGRNVLFDNLDYGQNFLVLYNNTQTHKQLYHRFLQHFSDKGSINLFVSAKNNPFQTSFGIRNSSFTKLDTATINKLKLDINKSVEEAEKGNKPVLLICDWADANMPSHSERGGEETRVIFLLTKSSCNFLSNSLENQRRQSLNNGKENTALSLARQN